MRKFVGIAVAVLLMVGCASQKEAEGGDAVLQTASVAVEVNTAAQGISAVLAEVAGTFKNEYRLPEPLPEPDADIPIDDPIEEIVNLQAVWGKSFNDLKSLLPSLKKDRSYNGYVVGAMDLTPPLRDNDPDVMTLLRVTYYIDVDKGLYRIIAIISTKKTTLALNSYSASKSALDTLWGKGTELNFTLNGEKMSGTAWLDAGNAVGVVDLNFDHAFTTVAITLFSPLPEHRGL